MRQTGVIACALVVAGSIGIAQAEETVVPWHLSDDPGCRVCLDIVGVWQSVGLGSPDVQMGLIELRKDPNLANVLLRHPLLPQETVEVVDISVDESKFELRTDIIRVRDTVRRLDDDQPTRMGKWINDRRLNPDLGLCKDAYKDEVTGENNEALFKNIDGIKPECGEGDLPLSDSGHALKMYGLVKAWPRAAPDKVWPPAYRPNVNADGSKLMPLGVAPGITVKVAFWNDDDHQGLLRHLFSRPNLRVLNMSLAKKTTASQRRLLTRLEELAFFFDAFGPVGSDGSPRGVLAVVAAGNVTFPSPISILDYRKTREEELFTITSARLAKIEARLGEINVAFRELTAKPDVPLLVVGGVARNGNVPEYTYRSDRIDLYAPTGELDINKFRNAVVQLSDASQTEDASAAVECVSDAIDSFDPRSVADAVVASVGVPTTGWPSMCGSPHLAPAVRVTYGTSSATALVSGVAGLLFSIDPDLTARQVRDILIASANKNIVNGLPVLEPQGAVQIVVDRLVGRWTTDLIGNLTRNGDLSEPVHILRADGKIADYGRTIESKVTVLDGTSQKRVACGRWTRRDTFGESSGWEMNSTIDLSSLGEVNCLKE